jgi:hypothetical protein
MRSNRLLGGWIALIVLLALASPALVARHQAAVKSGGPAPRVIPFKVAPVSGPSWLEHLGVSFDRTSMGRMGPSCRTGGGDALPHAATR